MLFDLEPPSSDSLMKMALGAIFTGGAGIIVASIRFINSHKQRVADRETSMRETGVEHSKDLTIRMENLMGAYEAHIKSLSDDLIEVKADNRALRAENERLKLPKAATWGEADAG